MRGSPHPPSHLIIWQLGHSRPLLLGRRPQKRVHGVKDHSGGMGWVRGSSPPGGGGSSCPCPVPSLYPTAQDRGRAQHTHGVPGAPGTSHTLATLTSTLMSAPDDPVSCLPGPQIILWLLLAPLSQGFTSQLEDHAHGFLPQEALPVYRSHTLQRAASISPENIEVSGVLCPPSPQPEPCPMPAQPFATLTPRTPGLDKLLTTPPLFLSKL